MAVGAVSVPSKTWVPPVGMIITIGSPTSPAALYDGTSWARITDRFLIGAGESYSLGSTGGSTAHTLTVAEMPAHSHGGSITGAGNHTHTLTAYTDASSGSYLNYENRVSFGMLNRTTSAAGAHSHAVSVGSSGGDKSFSILNQYIAKFIWRRVS